MSLTHKEIVNKLIGNIAPSGQSHLDHDRLSNLKDMCDLVYELVDEIKEVSKDKDRHEDSMKKMGVYADNFLKNELEIKN